MTDRGLQQREWILSVLDRYEVPLTRYAMRLLGQHDGARDAVQHAFLQLCSRSPEELRERVAQWLFTVCRNKALDLLRARQRTAPLEENEAPTCTSREADPALAAERHDLYVRLNRLVAELPPGQREAIDLWVEGFSYAQIARITGQSEGNVRVLVHRGLKRLRQHPVARELLGGPAAGSATVPGKPTSEVPL
jgi:RNA polymerase sigma factor (sigma-70 family)